MRQESQLKQFVDETTLKQYIDALKGLLSVSDNAITDQKSDIDSFNHGEIKVDAQNEVLVVRVGDKLLRTGLSSSNNGQKVISVFGRTGKVKAEYGDYIFSQIKHTPTTLEGYGITNGQLTIVKGQAVLDLNGEATVESESVTDDTNIFLFPSVGNSNMKINITDIIAGTSFKIVSSGGSDDENLKVNWMIVP